MTEPLEAARRIVNGYAEDGLGYPLGKFCADAKAVARELLARDAEIARLQDRLEMRHAWQIIDGQQVRVKVEPGSIPDGIECRNETIKLQDEQIASLKAEVERLREALRAARHYVSGTIDHSGHRRAVLEKADNALGRTP